MTTPAISGAGKRSTNLSVNTDQSPSISSSKSWTGALGAMVEIALEADAVKPLLQQLKAAFPTPDIIFWLIPIEESGRFS